MKGKTSCGNRLMFGFGSFISRVCFSLSFLFNNFYFSLKCLKKILMVQANSRELHFSMVDGDFKKFEGKWSLKSGKRYNSLKWLE